ncbi:MAG: hypothetical protein WKG07_15640 [Hymenobacter sp.]
MRERSEHHRSRRSVPPARCTRARSGNFALLPAGVIFTIRLPPTPARVAYVRICCPYPAPAATPDRVTLFVDVILPLPLPKLYTYRVPYELNDSVVIGGRVIVQFGAKRTLSCIVAAVHETPPKEYQAKYILEFIDDAPVVTQPQLKLFRWIG